LQVPLTARSLARSVVRGTHDLCIRLYFAPFFSSTPLFFVFAVLSFAFYQPRIPVCL
jgi:hypothetical protein